MRGHVSANVAEVVRKHLSLIEMILLRHLKAGFGKGVNHRCDCVVTAQVQRVQRLRSLNLDLKTVSQKNRASLAKQKC